MRKRARAVLVRVTESIALGGAFVGAVLLGVVVHANLPATRRLVVSVANDALAPLFEGRLVIGELRELSIETTGHARIAQAEIFDPDGHRVIFATGIDAHINLTRLIGSMVRGDTPEIILDDARIESAEVLLDFDPQGEIGIARAFLPRPDPKPKKAKPVPEVPTEDVRLSIAKAYVKHAWVHGNVVPPNLDADGDEIRAKVFIFDNRLSVEVDEARTTVRSPRVPGQAADVHGQAKGTLGVPLSAVRADIVMKWDLVGDAAGIPIKGHLDMEKDRITAILDVAPASPEVVRRAFPTLPLARPVELHASAEGALTKPLAIKANGLVGESRFTAEGELGLSQNQPFRVDVDVVSADAAAFAGGPSSDVSGHVHAEGAIAGGAPAGSFSVVTKPSTVLGERAPAVSAEGRFDAKRVDAKFKATEPGVDVDGSLVVHIPEQKLTFDVNARSKDLRAVARARSIASGSATAHATGTLDLATSTIDGRITADGVGVAHSPASAGTVHAEATMAGPVATPTFDVTARATQVKLRAGDKEPLTYPTATAHARVVVGPTTRVLDAELRVDTPPPPPPPAGQPAPPPGGGTGIVASAREIVIGTGAVDVRGARVTGLGEPLEADVRVEGGALTVRMKADNLDVHRLSAMTGIRELQLLPAGSRANVDVDVKSTATRADGHLDVTITSKEGFGGELHAKIDGRHITGMGRVVIGKLGWMELQGASINLPGAPSVRSFEQATGALDLRGELDLAQGGALFGGESIESMAGVAVLSARIERGDARNLPTVYASARTRDLDVILNRDGVSTHIGGIDAALHVGYDGASDETELSALTWDARGVVGSADAKARVPLVAWATGAKPIDRAAISALEVAGVVDIARRQVGDLPGIFARPDLLGSVAAHAELGGSIGHPRVVLVADGSGMTERKRGNAEWDYAPVNGVLEAAWDGTDVVATLRIDEDERAPRPPRADGAPRRPARKSGHVRSLVLVRAPAADLLAGRPLDWNGSGELDVSDLELAPLPLPMNMRGALTARVKVRDLAGTPSLEATARVDELGAAGVRAKHADVKIEARDGVLHANARVEQADGGSGDVRVDSRSLKWKGTAVAWDGTQSTELHYAVDRMRLSHLRPFVRSMIPEIDGRVDGSGSAVVDDKSQVFEGGIRLTDGRFYVNAIGEEIAKVSAVAKFERGGSFRIQDVRGKVGSGELTASASGRMKGLRFESAEAVVLVPSKDGVPLSAEGATFAEATGEVKLSAKTAPDSNTLLVTVTVPRARVALPDRAPQRLQALDPDKTVDIGVRNAEGKLIASQERPGVARRTREAAAEKASAAGQPVEAEPAGELLARFTVSLGDEVALEGRGLKLPLAGRTVVDLANEIAVTGQITLKSGGTIDVQGRKFVVDRGTVTFLRDEDPSDPIVIAAAYWTAPDRTRVWVEFNGPLKTGKLTLRSEPPHSKNEILSILLFGRADPNQGRPGDARPSNAQQATAIGSGIASTGLNQALGDLDEDFELEQDRTSANRLRTKLGYRLRRNLKVQLGYASGFSQREPDTTYLFLEWQFIPKWSLIGTRGDRGTSILDILFQHRY